MKNASIFLSVVITFLFVGCGPTSKGKAPGIPLSASLTGGENSQFIIGSGMDEITGPITGLATMGYSAPTPIGSGLHQRLRARAFIVANPGADKRVVHVTLDLCFITPQTKLGVVRKLAAIYGDLYTDANVMMTATHTHAAPGGMDAHIYYNIPSEGYSRDNVDAIVAGTVSAIKKAHDNLTPGVIKIARGTILDTAKNRSMDAYNNNPASERAAYEHTTDKSVTMLKFESTRGEQLGLIHWHAVHATAMEGSNTLISGDNKGFASWAFEYSKSTDYNNSNTFVAAFANSNAGDASPNIDGDVDGDGDWDCAAVDDFICAALSGNKHVSNAQNLYANASEVVRGAVDSRFRYFDYANVTVGADFSGTGTDESTCDAAIGLAMLAGSAEDGPGVGREGVACDGSYEGDIPGFATQLLCDLDMDPCQEEKSVALPTGQIDPPLNPEIISNQLFVIGNVAIVGVPAEITTMAGRRLRATVLAKLAPIGVTDVVIGAYSNAYTGYITTHEEYKTQHYEGGHTIFGPHTLAANQQNFSLLADSLVDGSEIDQGPEPHYQTEFLFEKKLPKPNDRAGIGRNFGDVLSQPLDSYSKGDRAAVTIVSSNPNTYVSGGHSVFHIEKFEGGSWRTAYTDYDWSTRFHWAAGAFGTSRATIEWYIPHDATPGTYRFSYSGLAQSKRGKQTSYKGSSTQFSVQ